jgi:hypothetical protein
VDLLLEGLVLAVGIEEQFVEVGVVVGVVLDDAGGGLGVGGEDDFGLAAQVVDLLQHALALFLQLGCLLYLLLQFSIKLLLLSLLLA